MSTLLQQIKNRRIALQLKQHDMMLRVGMSRQQYQRLESQGNPRLDTLELIARGLKSELVLVPVERMSEVQAILTKAEKSGSRSTAPATSPELGTSLVDDPWQNLLVKDE